MRKPSFYFIAGAGSVLAAIGAFLLFIFVLNLALESMFAGNRDSTTNVIATTPSPNQKYIATIYRSMGGGAAGWCSISVNIRKSKEQVNPEEDVFSSSCGTKIQTEWQSDGVLRISYVSDSEILSLHQKGWNTDKTVKILYVGK
ncbi:MAG TPA: DUF5412 family protein [Pyrinomonadaceae bacterium]|jgi:hypothetical protein